MLISVCTAPKADAPRILAVAPDTPDLPALNATDEDGELAAMRDDLCQVLHIDALIGTIKLTGKGSLADALLDGRYKTVHLITHGDDGMMALTGEIVDAPRLARLFTQHGVDLVLAMSCRSYVLAQVLAAAGVKNVIGVKGDIANDVARAFSREFYMGFARGLGVEKSVELAKSRLESKDAGSIYLLTAPVSELNLRGVYPDEVLAKLDALSKKIDSLATSDEVHALTQAVISLVRVVAQ